MAAMSRQPARPPRVLDLMPDLPSERGLPLRTLMALIALLGLAFSLALCPIGRVYQADRIADSISAVGGTVVEASEWSGRLRGPAGLHRVILKKRGLGDQGLGRLEGTLLRMPEMTELALDGNPITDRGLAHLRGLSGHRHLRVLSLGDTKVTDSGLVHLHGFSQLRVLVLDGSNVTGRGVAALKEHLPDTQIVMSGTW
jgi:hypothetical protein